ncbi:hypothetical protein DCAR_0832528 [Daucus carota subsp. sativus]|uniref:OTU domain-containing protein n=1 Tax=Daucus carota subsp. sativus TaxID=79200 RepID=A0AAF0XTT3_DAUCS|nr:PREDICTED: uncharacterized protein LOC108198476 [Daucus carota subsp. sativus]WOH13019.1 hypothetical protein DCAR_0832528 [Daucus carota subsp. sativus]
MRLMDKEGRGIELDNVHVFWRTLHMEGTSYSSDDHQTQFQYDDEILWYYFDLMLKQSSEVKKMYISQLKKMIHPESVTLEEPISDRKSKGRPTSRSSTKRDPSYFEHVDKKFKSSNKSKTSMREEYIPSEIPHFIVPYIHEYVNVLGDGNCGYRSVAHQIYGSEDQWRRVRMDLYDFIERRIDFWAKVWHKSIEEAWITLRKVNYCESPCPVEYWMSMDEMGPVIATMYNVILVGLHPIELKFGNLTYLPLYVPEGIVRPEKLICIAFLRKSNHFVSISLMDNCPIPVVYGFWTRFREDSVQGWDTPLMSRIENWKLICG